MANFSEKETIERLVVEFMVDQDMSEKAARDSAEALERQKQVAKEYSDLEDADFEASKEIQKEIQERHFENQTLALRAYYAQRLDMVRGNAEEERNIQAALDNDLNKLQEKQNAVNQQVDEAEKKSMNMGRNVQQMISGIGFGQLAGLASVAGVIAAISSATGDIREGHVAGGELAAGAGMGAEFAFPLAGRLRTIANVAGVGIDKVQRLAGEFTGIAQGGEAGAKQIAGLASQSMELGLGSGVDPTSVARLMVQFRVLEQEELPKLSERFAETVKMADRANVPAGQFVSWLTSASESLKSYSVSTFETSNLIGRFGRELQNGTMTIQQIVAGQRAVANAPEGLQAMVGQEIIEGGGPLAEFMKSRGATTPHLVATVVRAISQGSVVEKSGRIRHAETEEEKEMVGEQRQLIEAAIGNMLNRYSRQIAGDGGELAMHAARMYLSKEWKLISGDTGEATGGQLLQSIFGMDARDAAAMAKGGSKGLLEGTREGATLEDLLERGKELQDEQMTFQKEVWAGITGAFTAGVNDFNKYTALLLGDKEKYNRLVSEEAAAFDQATESGRMRGMIGRLTLENIKRSASPTGAGALLTQSIVDRIFINISDNTENKPVVVDAKSGENAGAEALPGQGSQ